MFNLDKSLLRIMRKATVGFVPLYEEPISIFAACGGCKGTCKGMCRGGCKGMCTGCKNTCKGKCKASRKGK